MKLHKTTIVIWTDFDPASVELAYLAEQATEGVAICTVQQSTEVDPAGDPEGGDAVTSFFHYLDEGIIWRGP